ncbi:unnamed protein product [Acanthoscelides obtectus]|uniref:Uncharacterized protein n=1 Tax=Acanthoscelides obtectus TaxID=200917 RepID=A0A9P0KBP9_ACAOB|nr:unnamed protein product [Acanthoscelides obtectus]CAK1629316.1 hypothetical protein AOBTE_LOCUS5677 [Acanthoscelides obtectus]
MGSNYGTALSHIILAGTGVYCYLAVKDSPHFFAQCSFGVIVANSLLGVWRWGNPSYGYDADSIYRMTSVVQDVVALPFIACETLLNYGYQKEMAYCDAAMSALPLLLYFADRDSDDLLGLVILANALGFGVLSFMNQNYFGIAASVSYIFAHFSIRKNYRSYFDIHSQDLYNYALCFYAYFAIRAVLD